MKHEYTITIEYYLISCDGFSYGGYDSYEEAKEYALKEKERHQDKDVEIIKVVANETVVGIV